MRQVDGRYIGRRKVDRRDRLFRLAVQAANQFLFGAGVLAHPFKLYDAVQEGQVDIAWSYPGFLVNADATNAILAGFPGGMAPETYMHWAFKADGVKLWEEFRRDKMGLMSFYSGQGTTEIFAHSPG